mgnify:CR=1 FL=1
MAKKLRVIDHEIVRSKQRAYADSHHHPDVKTNQVRTILDNTKFDKLHHRRSNPHILELFAGQGNLTKVYSDYGYVQANELKKTVYDKLVENINEPNVDLNRVNSRFNFHELIGQRKKFNVIDIDDYGFPSRFFPDIFLLMEDAVMFITMPYPSVNILNGITKEFHTSYFGDQNPDFETINNSIIRYGLCHWRKVELLDSVECGRGWRLAYRVIKVKATDYTGVRNR